LITRIRGTINRVLEDEVRIQAGPFEYQVQVPEIVRRELQLRVGEEVELQTMEFLDGNPTRGGRMTPRLIGFLRDVEMEFFDLLCTVDGIGIRTALRALDRPISQIAELIQGAEPKPLSSLPGISTASAERIIAKLRKKVTPFALAASDSAGGNRSKVDQGVIAEAFQALLTLGLSETDARTRIDRALAGGTVYSNPGDLIQHIYRMN
jgi:Holliday junction DNA helicase RuvA